MLAVNKVISFWQCEQREISLQQLEADLASTKRLYAEAIEENGRLEARIQAFALNAQSEQDVLSGEVGICSISELTFFVLDQIFILTSPYKGDILVCNVRIF